MVHGATIWALGYQWYHNQYGLLCLYLSYVPVRITYYCVGLLIFCLNLFHFVKAENYFIVPSVLCFWNIIFPGHYSVTDSVNNLRRLFNDHCIILMPSGVWLAILYLCLSVYISMTVSFLSFLFQSLLGILSWLVIFNYGNNVKKSKDTGQ